MDLTNEKTANSQSEVQEIIIDKPVLKVVINDQSFTLPSDYLERVLLELISEHGNYRNSLWNNGRTEQKLWAANPEKKIPIELHSSGLSFFFENGESVSIYTEDLIKLLKLKEEQYGYKYPPIHYKYHLEGDDPKEIYFGKGFFDNPDKKQMIDKLKKEGTMVIPNQQHH